MSKTIQEERLRWVLPIINNEMKISNVAKICPYSKRSLERWLTNYRKHGINGLIPKSTRPKTNPKETPIHLKEKIIALRKDSFKCALKLKWDLEKENIQIHHRTIGKILKSEKLTRKYRTKKVQYKYIRSKLLPGELVEIDVKHVPQKLNDRKYYQYTAIDCSSRWRYLAIYDGESNFNSVDFLKSVITRFPFKIKAIKTDNHSTFTNRYTGYLKSTDPLNPRPHFLDVFCHEQNIAHYLIDPGKPQQNGTIERSHRSDQESFYDKQLFNSHDELLYKIRLWNSYYNDLQHCSLNGLTPNQFLNYYLTNFPPYVCS